MNARNDADDIRGAVAVRADGDGPGRAMQFFKGRFGSLLRKRAFGAFKHGDAVGMQVADGALRLVRLKRSRGTVRFVGHVSEPLAPEGMNDPATISSLHAFAPDIQCVSVGLDGRSALVRYVDFPFSSLSKVSGVLPYELEGRLPFSTEGMSISFVPGVKTSDGGIGVLAGMLRQGLVQSAGEALYEGVNAPAVLDLEYSGLDAVANYWGLGTEQTVLMLDIGIERTLALLRRHGYPVFARTLSAGVGDMEDAWKGARDEGTELFFNMDIVSLEEQSRTFALGLRKLLSELMLSLEGCEWPELVVLSGVGARIPGLARRVEEALDGRCIILAEVASAREDEAIPEPALLLELAIAWGLALRGLEGGGFDFLPMQCRRSGTHFSKTARLALTAGAAFAVVLALAAWIVFAGRLFLTERAFHEMAERHFREALPEFSGTYESTQALSILRARSEEAREMAALSSDVALRELTVEVVRMLVVDSYKAGVTITSLDISPDAVVLAGTAPAVPATKKLQAAVAKRKLFVSVEVGKIKKSASGVGFTMTMTRRGDS